MSASGAPRDTFANFYASLGLPSSTSNLHFSSYCEQLGVGRFAALLKTVARADAGGNGIDSHLVEFLLDLQAKDMAKVEVEYGAVNAEGKSPVLNLRAFIHTKEQAAILRDFPTLMDIWTIDATFSPGNSPVSLMGIMGHLYETGGDSVALGFLVSLSAPAQAEGERTTLFKWFLDRGRDVGLELPFLTLADKCTATAKAWAQAAHERIEAASGERQTLTDALRQGGEGATAVEIEAAQALVDSFRDVKAVEVKLAEAAINRSTANAMRDGASSAADTAAADVASEVSAPISTANVPLDMSYLCSLYPALLESPSTTFSSGKLFKAAVREEYSVLLRGLCIVLLKDLDAAEMSRNATKHLSAAAFCDAHFHLRGHSAFWDLKGPAGSFLHRFCLPSYALCFYHAGAAIRKNSKKTIMGISKVDSNAILRDTQNIYITASSRKDALEMLAVYKIKWAGRASEKWFDYLEKEWFCESVCCLLLLSARDATPRLFLLTTNSIELLWNVLKNHYLRGRRVVDYVLVIKALVGSGGDSSDISLVSSKIKLVRSRISGLTARSEKAAVFKLARAVANFANSVLVSEVAVQKFSTATYIVNSSVPCLAFNALDQSAPASAVTNPMVHKTVDFYADTGRSSERIQNAIRVASGVTPSRPERPHHTRSDSILTPSSLAQRVLTGRRDGYSYLSQLHGLPRSPATMAAAEACLFPGVASSLLQLADLREQRLSDDSPPLRSGVGRGYQDSPLTAAAAAATAQKLDGCLTPALTRDLELNRFLTKFLEDIAGAPLRERDFLQGAVPTVGVVYVVGAKVPARVIDFLCQRHLRDGVAVSAIDGEPVPDGLRLLLVDVEHLSAALVAAGRGDELLTLLYIGSECRGAGQKRFLRYWDHFCGSFSGSKPGSGNDVAAQFLRWTSKKEGRVLTPVSEPVLPNGDRVLRILHFRRIVAFVPATHNEVLATEAFVAAVIAGRGAWLMNNSPPGEVQRYYESWGSGLSRAEIEVEASLKAAGGAERSRNVGIDVVTNDIVARRLQVMARLLAAGVICGRNGALVGELPDGRYSLWQCVSALTSSGDTMLREPFYVYLWADLCTLCASLRRHGGMPCKHLIYCRGLHVYDQLKNGVEKSEVEQPWWSRDTPAYLADLFGSESTAVPVVEMFGTSPAAVTLSLQGTKEVVFHTMALISLLPTLAATCLRNSVANGEANVDSEMEQLRLLEKSLSDQARATGDLIRLRQLAGASVGAIIDPSSVPHIASANKHAAQAASAVRRALGMDAVKTPRPHGGGILPPPDRAARSANDLEGRRKDGLTGPFSARAKPVFSAVAPPPPPAESVDDDEAGGVDGEALRERRFAPAAGADSGEGNPVIRGSTDGSHARMEAIGEGMSGSSANGGKSGGARDSGRTPERPQKDSTRRRRRDEAK